MQWSNVRLYTTVQLLKDEDYGCWMNDNSKKLALAADARIVWLLF